MKFKDQGLQVRHFTDHRLVRCPNCQGPIEMNSSTVVCTHCSFQQLYTTDQHCEDLWANSENLENYIQARCCGKILWAVNIEHLNFIEDYVQAKLRERKPNLNRSLASRLPQWIKNRKNRDAILKCIHHIKKDLAQNGLQDRLEDRLT